MTNQRVEIFGNDMKIGSDLLSARKRKCANDLPCIFMMWSFTTYSPNFGCMKLSVFLSRLGKCRRCLPNCGGGEKKTEKRKKNGTQRTTLDSRYGYALRNWTISAYKKFLFSHSVSCSRAQCISNGMSVSLSHQLHGYMVENERESI